MRLLVFVLPFMFAARSVHGDDDPTALMPPQGVAWQQANFTFQWMVHYSNNDAASLSCTEQNVQIAETAIRAQLDEVFMEKRTIDDLTVESLTTEIQGTTAEREDVEKFELQPLLVVL
jgi:hypothetical protein